MSAERTDMHRLQELRASALGGDSGSALALKQNRQRTVQVSQGADRLSSPPREGGSHARHLRPMERGSVAERPGGIERRGAIPKGKPSVFLTTAILAYQKVARNLGLAAS